MIEVRYVDRLGNRLFQYCLGRVLAESMGFALCADAIEGFARTFDVIAGASYTHPRVIYSGHRIAMESVLLDRSPRKIILNGWFQNYRYYSSHVSQIRAWLDLGEVQQLDHREDVLVHVRLGDLVRLGQALSVEYYCRILDRLTYRHAYLATDEPGHSELEPLLARGVRPLPAELTSLDTWKLARSFGTLVVGHATYSWWLGFFASDAQVHVGIPEHKGLGSFSLLRIADGLDLRVDEGRYTYYYSAPLIGEQRMGEISPLGDFCGMHRLSKAFLMNSEL